ncbi:hypothetical protein C7974DRAFT_228704 [Boeremia exigua]|uniref:uncharacterized protein n=1 Tax=Boeremia exigua TaxID=749465 RepID=UPI001E8E703B|nr:uncharacterized protein C7974DRAFT_228704 [Boeremia exigua]KAH6620235.1 hypothetical protein C7974DRAFT_228704 [Boeremia exigua]
MRGYVLVTIKMCLCAASHIRPPQSSQLCQAETCYCCYEANCLPLPRTQGGSTRLVLCSCGYLSTSYHPSRPRSHPPNYLSTSSNTMTSPFSSPSTPRTPANPGSGSGNQGSTTEKPGYVQRAQDIAQNSSNTSPRRRGKRPVDPLGPQSPTPIRKSASHRDRMLLRPARAPQKGYDVMQFYPQEYYGRPRPLGLALPSINLRSNATQ